MPDYPRSVSHGEDEDLIKLMFYFETGFTLCLVLSLQNLRGVQVGNVFVGAEPLFLQCIGFCLSVRQTHKCFDLILLQLKSFGFLSCCCCFLFVMYCWTHFEAI